jgi:glycerophosphoryl diester phosphodiesterase
MPRPRAAAVVVTLAFVLPPGLSIGHAGAQDSTHGTQGRRGHRFDLQAHRGGLALRPENTLSSFGNALRLGVSTLELDVQITEDGAAVVTHDRRVDPVKCADTDPVVAGDPEFPYVGKYVKTLTLAQVRTLDCGTRRPADPANDPFLPTLEMVPGSRMPLLGEVFDLVERYRAGGVTLNVETKVEAGAPEETAPREQFVQVVAREVRQAGASTVSANWQVHDPDLGRVASDDWYLKQDPSYFHGPEVPVLQERLRLEVVPYTVNDEPTMQRVIDLGVDGIISDDPDLLVLVAKRNGLR